MNFDYLACIGYVIEDNITNFNYHKVVGFRLLDLVSLSDFIVDVATAKRCIRKNDVLKAHIGRYYEKDMYINTANNTITYIGKKSTEDKVIDLGRNAILNISGSPINSSIPSKVKIKIGDLTSNRSLYLVYDLNFRYYDFCISDGNRLLSIDSMMPVYAYYESVANNEMDIETINKQFRLQVRSRDWYCKVKDLVICDLDRTLGSFKVDKIFNKFMCKSNKKAFDLIIFPHNIKYIAFPDKMSISGIELKFSPITNATIKIGEEDMSIGEFVNRANEFNCNITFY